MYMARPEIVPVVPRIPDAGGGERQFSEAGPLADTGNFALAGRGVPLAMGALVMPDRWTREWLPLPVLLAAALLGQSCDFLGGEKRTLETVESECCDLVDQDTEDATCCADTTWQTGEAGCDAHGGSGLVWLPNACCDPATEPRALEPAICCSNGTWVPSPGGSLSTECDTLGGYCLVCAAVE
jgi:hypothetical protein